MSWTGGKLPWDISSSSNQLHMLSLASIKGYTLGWHSCSWCLNFEEILPSWGLYTIWAEHSRTIDDSITTGRLLMPTLLAIKVLDRFPCYRCFLLNDLPYLIQKVNKTRGIPSVLCVIDGCCWPSILFPLLSLGGIDWHSLSSSDFFQSWTTTCPQRVQSTFY